MYSENQLFGLLARPDLDYLLRKNRGGTANQRGNTYESFFAVYQIALLAPRAIEDNQEIYLASQVPAFVDDLIIDFGAETALQHFQLKNSPTVSWGTHTVQGKIAYDFYQQKCLNRSALGRNSELFLVVSSENLQAKLSDRMPAELLDCSYAVFFPFFPNIDQFLHSYDAFKQAIAYLTAFEKPAPDKIECVAKILLGAWVASDKTRITVLDILKSAQQCQPSFIRSFLRDEAIAIDLKAIAILAQITGFCFAISRGFFHWEYIADGWTENGTLPYSCDSEEFQYFQNRIKKFAPSTFDELEVLLL